MNEICVKCGLPKNLCVCVEISKETQKIKVRLVRKKFNKVVTTVTGLDDIEVIKELAKTMKRKLACGGTVKDKEIELQGTHRDKVKKILLDEGYKQELIED
ncbi:MAG: stress response translation initiation inhibitor YciH [Candidatus Diapherotrites archaeon]|nr:stress response translation initiation inhibitor YciH [Candidatus Diapherotrites archaeon]